jgi:hypothetical protein
MGERKGDDESFSSAECAAWRNRRSWVENVRERCPNRRVERLRRGDLVGASRHRMEPVDNDNLIGFCPIFHIHSIDSAIFCWN